MSIPLSKEQTGNSINHLEKNDPIPNTPVQPLPTTPSNSVISATPSNSVISTTPSNGANSTTTADGNFPATPADSNCSATPADNNPSTTPTDKNLPVTPADSTISITPANGTNSATPSNGTATLNISSGITTLSGSINTPQYNQDDTLSSQRHRLSKDGSRVILRRQGKPHVSSACLHCRNSHLACDKNRPCNRCISSGKADDCFDTQHKKRGRPKSSGSSIKNVSNGKDNQSVPLAATCSSYQPSESVRQSSPIYSKRFKTKHLSPVLPLFEPQIDSRQYVDLLNPRATLPSPPSSSSSQAQPRMILFLDFNGICLSASCECDFLELDLDSFPGCAFRDWVHPMDHYPLDLALQSVIDFQPLSEDSSQIRLHLRDGAEKYQLVDMHLFLGERAGEIEARVYKFDLDTLLRLAPPGDLSLFM